MKRAIAAAIQVTLLVGFATVAVGAIPVQAATLDPCSASTPFPANDDSSVGPVSLGFSPDFFGSNYSDVYVNNNGNVTFNSPLGLFTPSPIGTGLGFPIIAPFWADVDTRGSGSAVTTYGTTTYGGHAAFCVSWDGVGYFASQTDKLNSFQLLLVDRSDVNAGDFDIVFNYNQIQWETGGASGGTDGLGGSSARAGYSDGSSNAFELPGSAVNGGLLDSNASTGLTQNSTSGAPAGQYVFPVRNGLPPSSSIAGTVWNDVNGNGSNDAGGGSRAPQVPGPAVQPFTDSGVPGVTVCLSSTGSNCNEGVPSTLTDENGNYVFTNLAPGNYRVSFLLPSGWHNTGALTQYDISLGSAENNVGNDFFIQQDASPASLSLTKSGSPDPVQEQNPITYTLDASNGGSGDANDVVVTDNLPAGTTFNQVTTTQGLCTHTATTVTCSLGTLGADSTATVTLIVQAPNVTANTIITNNASVSASNADTANASADTHVLVNTGGSTDGQVPPDTSVPLTFTTGTQSSNGQPSVNSGDKTNVSIIIPPGGPGGSVSLEEQPCPVAPCTGAAAAKDTAAQAVAPNAKVVLGGVPPTGYPNTKPFRVTLLYDKTLNPKSGPVWYFKQGTTPTEIKLPHCGTTPPNGGKPCVLTNALITTGPPAILGDWKVVVRINSDPKMRK